MPKGRMLNKKISYDEHVANMSVDAILLYTWCLPHLDVEGRLYADSYILKGLIVPYVDKFTPELIQSCLKEMEKQGLIALYGTVRKYLQFIGFRKNQNIREEREAPSEIPEPPEHILNLLQHKLSKDKLSKDKLSNEGSNDPKTRPSYSPKGVPKWVKDKAEEGRRR